MGSRASVCFKYEGGKEIWLYSHSQGYRMPELLQKAMNSQPAKGRLSDEVYYSRIVISQIIGNEWSEELGWGLSPYQTDWEYPRIIVHLKKKTIVFKDNDNLVIKKYTFDSFMDEKDVSWGAILPGEYISQEKS